MTINDTHYPDSYTGLSEAAGYRDVGILVTTHEGQAIRINLRAADTLAIWRELGRVLSLAWHDGSPCDVQPGERRPADIPAYR